MQILDLSYSIRLERRIGKDGIFVRFEKLDHVRSHKFTVNVEAKPGALQGERGDLEFPGIADDHGGAEEALVAFLAKILSQ